jgi:glycosyltransferase involved in cell wall biosynthesis
MRIGLDASWAAATGTGTASYTDGLVHALVNHEPHEYVLYFRPGDDARNPLWKLSGPTVTRRSVDGWGQPGRSLVSLARAAARDRLDVFHSPGYFLPLWSGPKVVTFHDVNMFLEWDTWWRPGMRAGWLSLCLQTLLSSRLARIVLADSRDAARKVQNVLRLDPCRISVLYPGVDERFFQPPSAEQGRRLRERHGLDEYLLFVGVLSPQKNLEGVVRAFAAARRPHLKLAIVGKEDGPYFRQTIAPLVSRLGLASSVEVLGVVPGDALPQLYSGAAALLHPSFAEGFGLPPLEAMACGTPVIASNLSSLPEVLGNDAMLIDPHDVDAIAGAIQRVIADQGLRDRLQTRGIERAGRFRWRESARRALEIYASVA